MNITLIVSHYLFWHYSVALVRFTAIYRNIVFFVADFFSLSILLKSFFAPWRRLSEPYPKDKFNLSEVMAVLVVNSLMRLVGIIMRSIIILVGLVVLVLTVFIFPLLILLWLVLPPATVLLMVAGLKLLFL